MHLLGKRTQVAKGCLGKVEEGIRRVAKRPRFCLKAVKIRRGCPPGGLVIDEERKIRRREA